MLTIHFVFTQCACISVDFINPTYPYLPVSPPPPPLFLSFFSLSQRHPVVFSSLAINIVLLYMIY